MLAVEAALEAIGKRPESFPAVHRDVRRALLKRFPDGIYFIKEMDWIRIIAIFHARRNPKSWQQRIGP